MLGEIKIDNQRRCLYMGWAWEGRCSIGLMDVCDSEFVKLVMMVKTGRVGDIIGCAD